MSKKCKDLIHIILNFLGQIASIWLLIVFVGLIEDDLIKWLTIFAGFYLHLMIMFSTNKLLNDWSNKDDK